MHYSPLFPRLCDERNGIVLNQQDINRTNVNLKEVFFSSYVKSNKCIHFVNFSFESNVSLSGWLNFILKLLILYQVFSSFISWINFWQIFNLKCGVNIFLIYLLIIKKKVLWKISLNVCPCAINQIIISTIARNIINKTSARLVLQN